MKKMIVIVIAVFIVGCKSEKLKNDSKIIKTDTYELIPSKSQKGLLILFPGGGGNPENIKRELLPQIFDYREHIENELLDEAHEVAFDFKSERMDPRRPILAWE